MTTTGEIAAKGRRAGRSPWVERLGRAGLVAKGVIYAVIGILAIKVVLGGRAENPDRPGALRAIGEQPFGKGLLVLLAGGLAGYAAWRLAQAVLDRDSEGEDAKGLAKRGGSLAKAALLRNPLRTHRLGPPRRREPERRRQRAGDHRRGLRPARRSLPRLRGRRRLRGRGGFQRLPRGHLQVQQEAEAGRDEQDRGGGRHRRRCPRAPGADGRVRADRHLPRQGCVGVRLARRHGGSTARCSRSRNSTTAASSSVRSRSA